MWPRLFSQACFTTCQTPASELPLSGARDIPTHNYLGFARLPEENVIDGEVLLGCFNCSGAGLAPCDSENNTHTHTHTHTCEDGVEQSTWHTRCGSLYPN